MNMKKLILCGIYFILATVLTVALDIHADKLKKCEGITAVSVNGNEAVFSNIQNYLDKNELVEAYSFCGRNTVRISGGNRSLSNVTLYNTAGNHAVIITAVMLSGDFDVEENNIVISKKTAVELFSNVECVGFEITVNGIIYNVSGVFDDTKFITERFAETDNFAVYVSGFGGYDSIFVKTNADFTEIFQNDFSLFLSSAFINSGIHNLSVQSLFAVFVSKLILAVNMFLILLFICIIIKDFITSKKFYLVIIGAIAAFYILVAYVLKVKLVLPTELFKQGKFLDNVYDYFISLNHKSGMAYFQYHLSAQGLFFTILIGLYSVIFTLCFLYSLKIFIKSNSVFFSYS